MRFCRFKRCVVRLSSGFICLRRAGRPFR
ncbi:hypothetical protein LINPERPRIM_LOCUS6371 [Linum perenne]